MSNTPDKTSQYQNFLLELLSKKANPESVNWLKVEIAKLEQSQSLKDLGIAFGLVPRKLGREKLQTNAQINSEANNLRKGWNLENYSLTDAGRITLLLAFSNSPNFYPDLEKLFNTAEMSELVALYLALPLLPNPEKLIERAKEGFRSNIAPVFRALALNNPFPADYLSDAAFNQMVLKAAFTAAPLNQISGLKERLNPQLQTMMQQYIAELTAAGREVRAELVEVAEGTI